MCSPLHACYLPQILRKSICIFVFYNNEKEHLDPRKPLKKKNKKNFGFLYLQNSWSKFNQIWCVACFIWWTAIMQNGVLWKESCMENFILLFLTIHIRCGISVFLAV